MEIRIDDLRGPEIARLLEAHMADMHRWTPPESIHALDLESLRTPDITFWTVWDGTELVSCGALREIDCGHGEIKSMHTSKDHRGRGIAARLLTHIIAVGRERTYRRLSLETGAMAEFQPARNLYAGFGFVECGPFAGYAADPNSAFMTMELPPQAIKA